MHLTKSVGTTTPTFYGYHRQMSDTSQHARPTLLVGLPRSGTTWCALALALAQDVLYANEPDDAYRWPEAFLAKVGLGDYPIEPLARRSVRFQKLWQHAATNPERFAPSTSRRGTTILEKTNPALLRASIGRGRSTRTPRIRAKPTIAPLPTGAVSQNVLLKAVTIAFCAEAVSDSIDAQTVVIRRDPRRVIASWSKMDSFTAESFHKNSWIRENVIEAHDMSVPTLSTETQKLAWAIAVQDVALQAAAKRRDWLVVRHEDLYANPLSSYKTLVQSLGWVWTREIEAFLSKEEREGHEYEIDRTREQLDTAWKQALTTDQWQEVDLVLKAANLQTSPPSL